MDEIMYLNIEIAGTERDIDIYLNDEDEISILYCPSNSDDEEATSSLTFRELFDLMESGTKTENLRGLLDIERVKNERLMRENENLYHKIGVLTRAFEILKK